MSPGWPFGFGTARRLDLDGLARLLGSPAGISFVLASLDAQALALAQVAAWHGGTVAREQAAEEAPKADVGELDASAQVLRERLLTDPHDGWLTLRADVAAAIDLPGVPAEPSLRYANSDVLAERLRALGQPVPPRKAERIAALTAALRDPDVIERAVADLPDDAAQAFAILVRHGPQRVTDLGIPRWPPYGPRAGETSIGALMGRGLAGVDIEQQVCLLWLDALVGWRGGRLFGDAFPAARQADAVPLVGGSAGVVALPPVLEHLDALLTHWQARPAEALNGGGLGVRPVRAAAKSLGLTGAHVGLLAHLAAEVGLLGVTETGSSGRGRNRQVHRRWAPTPLVEQWRELPATQQWAHLVHAWRESPRLSELDGLPERFEPDAYASDVTTVAARSAWLRLLAGLADEHGLAEDQVARVAASQVPVLLSDRGHVEALLTAVRVLGLVPPSGPVGLSAAGRAVLDGPGAVETLLPAGSTEIVVQADLTVIVPPDAIPEVTGAVARWADLESHAGARVYRLSERRLAAALAAGEDADEVVGWLTTHSRVGIPQNVDYLIRDVARRRGQVRAGTAASYLRCDDPAMLTGALGVRAAKLRPLAPTVAVSPLSRDKLLAALADRGVAAVAEDASGATVAATAPEAERVGWHHAGPGLPALHPLPEVDAIAAHLIGRTSKTQDDGRRPSRARGHSGRKAVSHHRRPPYSDGSPTSQRDDGDAVDAEDVIERLKRRDRQLRDAGGQPVDPDDGTTDGDGQETIW